MKKIDPIYIAIWYGGTLFITVILIIASFSLNIPIVSVAAMFFFIFALVFVPGILSKRMQKNALKLEKEFARQGFQYQQKFTSNSGVFYIDISGRLAVVWRGNPKQLYFVDLSKVTNIRTNDGRQFNGTSLVSCQFMLDKKWYKIYTLRVSNGQYSMKSPEVLEAISKADKLCEMLNTAKQNALKAQG